jgi:hypothetical protein
MGKSRPPSEIRDAQPDGAPSRRVSTPLGVHTITVNLVDYAAQVNSALGSPKLPASASSQASNLAPPPPSPSTKPGLPPPKPEKPTALRTVSMTSIQEGNKVDEASMADKANKGDGVPKAEGKQFPDGEAKSVHPDHSCQQS